jgi:uncharacterized membrane protein
MYRSPFVKHRHHKNGRISSSNSSSMHQIDSVIEGKSLAADFLESLQSQLKRWFIRAIPSDDLKQLPPNYFYPLGSLLIILFISIFLSIFALTFNYQISNRYLTSTSSADPHYCDQVLISNTGQFLATKTGLWEDNQGFSYSAASYALSVNSFSVSSNQYGFFMNNIYNQLVTLDEKAVNNNLAINLLYWMTYVFLDPEYPAQRFYFLGNPLNVFYREDISGGISNLYYDCVNISSSSYDQANGRMLLSYNINQFQIEPQCTNIVSPSLLGYSKYFNPSSLQISIDVRSMIVALAVNIGIISVKILQEVQGSTAYFTYNGQVYNTSNYFDPQFPNMKPITCMTNPTRCIIQINQAIGIPVFNQIGTSLEYPNICNCSQLHNLSSSSDEWEMCNSFTFLTGVLFYNTSSPIPIFQLSMNYSFEEINQLSYEPMFIGSTFGLNSPYYSQMNAPENRSKAYSFCQSNEYGSCSFITFTSYDESFPGWDISSYYYQLKYGACNASFAPTSYSQWENLINSPFTSLTQDYESCRYSPSKVFFTMMGSSFGALQLLIPFCVILLITLLYLYQCCCGVDIPRGYSSTEKSDILDGWAIILLLLKDQKKFDQLRQKYFEQHRESNHKQILEGLAAEGGGEEEMEFIRESRRLKEIMKELAFVGEITEEEYYNLKEHVTPKINWQEIRNRANTRMIGLQSNSFSSNKEKKLITELVGNPHSSTQQEQQLEQDREEGKNGDNDNSTSPSAVALSPLHP